MNLLNDVHFFITDLLEQGVHGHNAFVYDDGTVEIETHCECMPAYMLFAILSNYEQTGYNINQGQFATGETIYVVWRTRPFVPEAIDCLLLSLQKTGEARYCGYETAH